MFNVQLFKVLNLFNLFKVFKSVHRVQCVQWCSVVLSLFNFVHFRDERTVGVLKEYSPSGEIIGKVLKMMICRGGNKESIAFLAF